MVEFEQVSSIQFYSPGTKIFLSNEGNFLIIFSESLIKKKGIQKATQER